MIHRIALTGGPCGGKSTALPLLAKHFREQGLKVYTTPEMATLFHEHGVHLKLDPPGYQKALEDGAFQVQWELEEAFARLARQVDSKPALMLHDRGLTDLAAYATPEMWEEIVSSRGFTSHTVKLRYDMVLHLTTTAIGAEQFFTNENNPARQCTPALAAMLDRKSLSVWTGHPRHVEIDNSTDFDGKMKRAIAEVENYLSKTL